MDKKSVIILIIFGILSVGLLMQGKNIYNYFNNKYFNEEIEEYLTGSATGEHGKLSLKIKVDGSGAIKEVAVLEHPNSDVSSYALQKLINDSLDKYSSSEIDVVSGATETSNLFKTIIASLIDQKEVSSVENNDIKVSLKDPNIAVGVERVNVNDNGFKSGVGAYVINQLQDADYNKNGNLVTHEYICAVVLNKNNRIEDVKFDHIASNISFNRKGEVPTGGAKAYNFLSDKSKAGFNGFINDGNYINIFEFEEIVLANRHFDTIKEKYNSKRGYSPLINALENAIENAKFIGTSDGDTLGLAANKVLKKKDIIDATNDANGSVFFTSNYSMVTINKNNQISASMFDNVENLITLTNDGKILGSRDKEIYTLNELSNTEKYSKLDGDKHTLKVQYNFLSDYFRGNNVEDVLAVISKATEANGQVKAGNEFENLTSIDFIEVIDLVSRAYVDAVKIQ